MPDTLFGIDIPEYPPSGVFPHDPDFNFKRGRKWNTKAHRFSPLLEQRFVNTSEPLLTIQIGFSAMKDHPPGHAFAKLAAPMGDTTPETFWDSLIYFTPKPSFFAKPTPFLVKIEREVILITWNPHGDGRTVQADRAQQGTSIAWHNTGTRAYYFTPGEPAFTKYQDLFDFFNAHLARNIPFYFYDPVPWSRYARNSAEEANYRDDPTVRISHPGGTDANGVEFSSTTGRYIGVFDSDELSFELFEAAMRKSDVKILAYPG